MYLFDTDTLSNPMRKSPSGNLVSRMRTVPVRQQFTSNITLGEPIFGARKKGSARLLADIHRLVPSTLPILPFDADAATRYGEVRADLEKQGMMIGDADIRIASIALVRGLTVVTGNLRHFNRVSNLPVDDWI